MRGYKFKLETVLKMRRFAEEKCRNELGQLYVEKNKIQDKIIYQKNEIEKLYSEQESQLGAGVMARNLSAFPTMIQGKEKLIQLYKADLVKMDQFIKIKNDELIQRKSELKMMENIKEKDFLQYKTEYNKKMNQTIEEQQMYWRESAKINEGEA